jgi:O-antigen ligase
MRAPAPLHPLERALVVVASIHLCFLPWAMGTRAPWAQLVSLGFALIAFALALWPRRYVGELAPDGPFTLHTWPRLVRFPIFWLGLGFLGYIALGAFNPAWERISTDLVWYIRSKEHADWLPSSIEAPFANMNAWRMLTIYGAAWLLACALWTALTRRTAVQSIITVLVVNGFVLSLIAITQKMAGTKLMLWFIKAPADYFHGTFVYKNHAGAYFNLIFAIALATALWHHVRGLRRLERGSPAPVFAFAVVVLAACVFMSGSRTAMLLLAGYGLATLIIYLTWRSRARGTVATNPAVSGLMAATAIVVIVAAGYFLNLEKSVEQIRLLTTESGHRQAIESRVLARKATYDLFREQPLTGWGAGSFRHAFPIYQQNYPQIFRATPHPRHVYFWDHAHNDYVQTLAELGLIGAVFPALALLWLLFKLCRLGALAQPSFLVLTLGLGLILAHSWVDFPLYNPAILATFCAVWIMTVRWAELETRSNER